MATSCLSSMVLLEIGNNAVNELLEKESIRTKASVKMARSSRSTGEIVVRCREILQQDIYVRLVLNSFIIVCSIVSSQTR